MTEERSTLQFRSNIYPTSTRGLLINDRKFLASISDPEALDILWRYNGSRGSLLTRLQQRQHDAAKHCKYAEDEDLPWGTPVGSNRVVCLCEKTDCPLFSECMNPESDRGSRKSPQRAVSGKDTMQPRLHKASTSSSAAGAGSAVRPRAKKSIFLEVWSEGEKRRLREAYPKCSRETLYKMFPNRSTLDIDMQIELMGLPSMPQPRKPKPKKRSGGRPRTGQADTTHDSQQQATQKRRGKDPKKPKPWTVNEDVIIRNNYSRFGTDVKRWTRQLQGRKKSDIEKRAKQLGLVYRPPRRSR